MSRLSDLLNDSNTGRLSARRIQALAEVHGVKVAHASISKYLRGEPETPSETILHAFSVALNIPMTKLREAAGVPAGEPEPFVLPESANRLTARQSVSWSFTPSGSSSTRSRHSARILRINRARPCPGDCGVSVEEYRPGRTHVAGEGDEVFAPRHAPPSTKGAIWPSTSCISADAGR